MTILLACMIVLCILTPTFANTPERSSPPVVGDPPGLVSPVIERRVMSNGIPVWFSQRQRVPLFTIDLLLKAGQDKDPADKYGVAYTTNSCLGLGTDELDMFELSKAFSALGASTSDDCSWYSASCSVGGPTEHMSKILSLWASKVLCPSFPQARYEVVRKSSLVSSYEARTEPAAMLASAFQNILYPSTSRLRYPACTPAFLKASSAADLRQFHQEYYVADNAAFMVAGDVNPDQVMDLLEKYFGSWKRCSKQNQPNRNQWLSPAIDQAQPVIEAKRLERLEARLSNVAGRRSGQRSLAASSKAVRDAGDRTVYFVNKNDAVQSNLLVGCPGIQRSSSLYTPLKVMNTVLGGSFTSRLNDNLRERNQYTYGAVSQLNCRKYDGIFGVYTSVQNDKTGPALREIFRELYNIRQPIGEEELTRAKKYLSCSLLDSNETTSELCKSLGAIMEYGLPDDYLAQLIPATMSVDSKTVSRAAGALIEPRHMITVCVGNQGEVVPQLESLGYKVIILDINDLMGPEIKPE